MELAREEETRASPVPGLADATLVLAAFAATLFLSALLLFSVQPMFARMVLPKLGGSPSVWAVSMCFFQGVLLVGYCYAHLLNRLAGPRVAPIVHLAVMLLALLTLPIGLPESRSEPPAGDAYLWLVGTLALGVGLPFFAVAANAPLLQAWFARSGHPQAHDPYFLYGASNLGSLLALLAYPVVVEPMAGLGQQAGLWSAGFVALMAMIMAAAGLGLVHGTRSGAGAGAAAPATPSAATAPAGTAPDAGARLAWVSLAFVPSGLLVAFTSFVSTDVASAPFLWVIPLALFLLTFILVFTDRPLIPHRTMLLLQVVATAVVLLGLSMTGNRGWLLATIFGSVAFFAATMVCHRELYERRPASGHLTEFYLWMSLGGVLGGVFAAIVAPQVFNAIWEFPLLLVLAMACRPGALARSEIARARDGLAIAVAMVALMVLVGSLHRAGLIAAGSAELTRVLIIIGAGALALFSPMRAPRQLVLMAVAALAVVTLPSAMNRGDSVRSFFGTHRIAMSNDGTTRLLLHGTTVHGAERLVDPSGKPVTRPVPATYYHPASPMARGVEIVRLQRGARGSSPRIGIVPGPRQGEG